MTPPDDGKEKEARGEPSEEIRCRGCDRPFDQRSDHLGDWYNDPIRDEWCCQKCVGLGVMCDVCGSWEKDAEEWWTWVELEEDYSGEKRMTCPMCYESSDSERDVDSDESE